MVDDLQRRLPDTLNFLRPRVKLANSSELGHDRSPRLVCSPGRMARPEALEGGGVRQRGAERQTTVLLVMAHAYRCSVESAGWIETFRILNSFLIAITSL